MSFSLCQSPDGFAHSPNELQGFFHPPCNSTVPAQTVCLARRDRPQATGSLCPPIAFPPPIREISIHTSPCTMYGPKTSHMQFFFYEGRRGMTLLQQWKRICLSLFAAGRVSHAVATRTNAQQTKTPLSAHRRHDLSCYSL